MRRPLDGVRVVEVSYGAAAPFAGRYLAVLGADVVRVESRRRPDGLREGGSPWLPDDLPAYVHMDVNPILELVNGSKRSVVFELDTPGGYGAFLQLIRTADIFLSNLAPPALDKLRLGTVDLTAVNQDLICINVSTFGTNGVGKFREYRTWGHNVGAFCGLSSLSGWPEDPPLLWPFNYTDFMCGLYTAFLGLAGLAKRRRDGGTVEIEVAIHELVAASLGDDFERCLNGEPEPDRQGNDDARYMAQGVFPVIGDDRWVAITLRDPEDCKALGIPPGTDREAICERLAAMLRDLSYEQVRSRLEGAAVPWEIVASSQDLTTDPRLQRDGYWQLLPHFRLGTDMVAGLPFIWDGRRLGDTVAAPAFGQHTECVLQDIGFSPVEAAELVAAGEVSFVASPGVQIGPRPWLQTRPLPLGLSFEDPE